MKKIILFFFVLLFASCETTKIGYSDDVYYSSPIIYLNEFNHYRNWYLERQIFPQFYYGYPYVPFDLLINQPGIDRTPRRVNTPKQSTPKSNTAPIRKFDNKN